MMLVVSGMRSTSMISSVTFQLPSSFWTPSTEDTRRPSNCSSSPPARCATCRTPSFLRLLPSSSPSAILLLPPARVGHAEAFHQVRLRMLALLFGQLAILPEPVQFGQLSADPTLVVELAVGLLGHLLADPGHPLDGREGQREQTRDQAHAGTSPSRSTNECGGSGPKYLSRTRSPKRRSRALTAASNASSLSSSTRNAALSASSSCAGSLARVSTARGESASSMALRCSSRTSVIAAATCSPS